MIGAWRYQGDEYWLEELTALAMLLYEEIAVTEDLYLERLHQFFLKHPEDPFLLDLECQTDLDEAMLMIRRRVDCRGLDRNRFGRVLMGFLKEYYAACGDLGRFAKKARSLWEDFPLNIQKEMPFWALSWADEPLSWKDEAQSRSLYEAALCYYDNDPPPEAEGGAKSGGAWKNN